MKRDFAIAVKAVIVKDEKVLVLSRSQDEMNCSYMNNKQKWDLPGGGLHFYEHAQDGLCREIKEETNLEVFVGEPVSLFDVIKNHIHLCIFTYACRWKGGSVALSEEHDAFVWMTKEEVTLSALPNWMKRDLLRALDRDKNVQKGEIE
ncbi:NUDIX hydrolase [Anaerotignum propionicum]|uniref:8-oxo-dGTP diphosphatase n=1 Tax=Anaerotignum propionicum DSM 1682 TaxID=991789 RepID=A0A0X8VCK7_ANAPI|nr:NUDIX domain-containing protein [Anaerotignum propionicum]AMJ40320.1 RNA pyrophosphohydrolase [Anaerotignum propionicum DSM 1682]MEA5057559.1 NUDIX domain-containing protein [Anaerotignum propionicum]SHE45104.1 8-oxo-dGTP diphosphatase [[Clostridium] propionicum DSM 1682] [Anaerotignum propionicum DSM 1682]